MPTTCVTNQAKFDFLTGSVCMMNSQTGIVCTGLASQYILTNIPNTVILAVGMAVTGPNLAVGAVIASVDSPSQVTLSKPNTGPVISANFTADVFKILLIKPNPLGVYDQTLVNVGTPGMGAPSISNVGTDEVTGTGYTTGGFTLTNSGPSLSANTAVGTFSVNPSWVNASLSAICAVIWNTTARTGAAATPLGGHTISIHDFGNTVTVLAGTLTLIVPPANASTGLIKIS